MVIPALALALGLTACGGDGSGSHGDGVAAVGGGGGAAGSPEEAEEAELAFYDCLRDAGLDVPDPDPSPGIQLNLGALGIDPNDPDTQAALEECQGLLPGGGPSGSPPDAEQLEQLRTFTGCMRENGVDMADPGSDGTLSVPAGTDPDSAEFQDAMEACREHLNGVPVRMRAGGGQ